MNPEKHPLYEWLKEIRRDFHMHPETAFQEFRTTDRIKSLLTEMGIQLQELDGLETGAAGVIEGKPGGKTIALRADIDALPLTELNDAPYKSTIEGAMHACGHDAHMTIMLGVAKNLKDTGLDKAIKGRVKFIFQPAEERLAGAQKMIDAGVLKNPGVDRIAACHVFPDLEVGRACVYKGVSHAAADHFRLVIQGKGSHGAHPEHGNDPIVAGAFFVAGIQSIVSRNISPLEPGVVTVGSFHSGTVGNIIPAAAELQGTVRSLNPKVREELGKRMREMAGGLETTFGVSVALDYQQGVPACINDETVTAALFEASSKVVGRENVGQLGPTMGSEDFGLFTQLVPGSIMYLGCANQARGLVNKLHSPHFDLDEAVLPIGVEIFTEAVKEYLRR